MKQQRKKVSKTKGTLPPPLHNQIAFSVSINLRFEEMLGWHPDQIRAFMQGVGAVIEARAEMNK